MREESNQQSAISQTSPRSGRLKVAQQLTAGFRVSIKSESVKRTAERSPCGSAGLRVMRDLRDSKHLHLVSRPLRGLQLFARSIPSSELLGYFRSSANADCAI